MEKIKRITPFEAGQILGTNAETIRAGLRANKFPFGVAIPPEDGKKTKWTYIIMENKFLEFLGKEEKTNENKK